MTQNRSDRFLSRSPAFLLASALLALGLSGSAGSAHDEMPADGAEVLARVAGQPVTRADVEVEAAAALAQLESQRRDIIERTLEQVIEKRLFEVEAAARGIGVDELVSEIESKAGEVTGEEVDAWYEENQARIRQPKEQIHEQIRDFLTQQRRQAAHADLLKSLRTKHAVRILLEPLRADVVVAGAPTKGPAGAPVTIVEFSDFECPFCSRLNPTLEQVIANYGDQVRLVFRHFPLTMHPHAQKAAEAAICAHDQGEFWEMHDAMFADQRALSVEQLKTTASELGLDAERFAACLDSGEHAGTVAEDMEAGQNAGVTGTPALFINGRLVAGAAPYEQIAKVIDDELERQRSDD